MEHACDHKQLHSNTSPFTKNSQEHEKQQTSLSPLVICRKNETALLHKVVLPGRENCTICVLIPLFAGTEVGQSSVRELATGTEIGLSVSAEPPVDP